MFFVDRAVELQSSTLFECTPRDFFKTAESQYAFEVSVYNAALTHVDRTYDLFSASVILIPFLPYLSSRTGKCDGKTHGQRLKELLHAVERAPRTMPIVITCTCVMEHAIFGQSLFDRLHAFSNVVQLAKAPRSYPKTLSNHVIVVPYFSVAQPSAACSENGIILWRGSSSVAGRNATLVRERIMSFRNHPAFNVSASRRRGECSVNTTCITGNGLGRDKAAKERMRNDMAESQFCLVPEGDSPESSRLADAISSLCTPVVLSTRLPVLLSDIWKSTIVVIDQATFRNMNADEVVRRVRSSNITCEMRLKLRHETLAATILHRLDALVRQSSRAHVSSKIGR
jgi:hypothetical protein